MKGGNRRDGNPSMAGIARERLGHEIARWLLDPTEQDWLRKHPGEDFVFWRYARFFGWLRTEAVNASMDLADDKVLLSAILRQWMLSLPNFMAAYDLAAVLVAERLLEERAQTNLKVKDRAKAKPDSLWMPPEVVP